MYVNIYVAYFGYSKIFAYFGVKNFLTPKISM